MSTPDSPPSVVIVGGGFAGVGCAKELGKHGVPVTLLDRHNYPQFQPLLYQVATAELSTSDIARPLRAIFNKDETVAVKQLTVTAVDRATRTVTWPTARRSPTTIWWWQPGRVPTSSHAGRRAARLPAVHRGGRQGAADPPVRGLRGRRQRPGPDRRRGPQHRDRRGWTDRPRRHHRGTHDRRGARRPRRVQASRTTTSSPPVNETRSTPRAIYDRRPGSSSIHDCRPTVINAVHTSCGRGTGQD